MSTNDSTVQSTNTVFTNQQLLDLANELDDHGMHKEADKITEVLMKRADQAARNNPDSDPMGSGGDWMSRFESGEGAADDGRAEARKEWENNIIHLAEGGTPVEEIIAVVEAKEGKMWADQAREILDDWRYDQENALQPQAQIVRQLIQIANALDNKQMFVEADVVTEVMEKVAQSPFNEAGEPIMTAEQWRREQDIDSDPRNHEFDPDDYRPSADDEFAERQSEAFEQVFNLWAEAQDDLDKVVQTWIGDQQGAWQQEHAPIIEQRKQQYPDTFDPESYIRNKMPYAAYNFDLKDEAEQWILANPASQHRDWDTDDPDTMHQVLDALKQAILNHESPMTAINSVPATGSSAGDHHNYREDFGWGGDERLFGE